MPRQVPLDAHRVLNREFLKFAKTPSFCIFPGPEFRNTLLEGNLPASPGVSSAGG